MYGLLFAAAMLCPTSAANHILKEIDNTCSDTWCGGDYAYRFKKVILEPATDSTRVLFTMSIAGESELEHGATLANQSFDVSCRIDGYSTYSEVMESENTLDWGFYLLLTDCIQTLEEHLSR